MQIKVGGNLYTKLGLREEFVNKLTGENIVRYTRNIGTNDERIIQIHRDKDDIITRIIDVMSGHKDTYTKKSSNRIMLNDDDFVPVKSFDDLLDIMV